MHEMSIALDILRIVEKTAHDHEVDSVEDIFLQIGSLAGVMIHSLEFCLEVAKSDTVADHAAIHIDEVAAEGNCPNCHQAYPMNAILEACPQCPEYYLTMHTGDQLKVVEIEIERAA